ncbi:sugar ABC transporter substrate-binding protein [Paenibacillus baekrokdamisoli]|uniref:Sugar ABC transporter substrate-binding protein n=1 Tax=Paenibacillus baekrokdamisoli TaxID=1712516 RepID=A0A3G9IX47_9BACL|nr:sugar ABC transporter substrate-binding protein [Paenibacillus baekrokdamisoli]MBB3068074.1 multiple sugar transport system substrate-binding protein [Paenibacillus baekrokdamisoli]BBH22882.1 sugar ABC transporter substrate-binding protein [Paenibacillus baekrokdamisoli]
MKKRITWKKGTNLLLTVLLVALVISGCSKSNTDKKDGESSKKPVTITYYTIDSPDRTFVEKLIPDFQKRNPGIKVKVEKAPYEQFDSKLQTLIAGGNAPDVTSHYGYGGFAEYYNKGMLLDMTDLIKEDGFDPSSSDYNIPADIMKIYTINNHTYGIPINMYVTLMLYNKDMFDEAKVAYPPSDYEDKSWTFDKMVEAAKKMTVVSDDISKTHYGVDFTWAERDNRPLYFGAEPYSADTWTNGGVPSSTHFDSPEVMAAYNKLFGLIFKDKVSPNTAWSKSVAGQNGDPFVSGKIAMSIGGSWNLAGANDFPFKVGVAAVPVGGNDKVRSTLYVDPLFILKDSKHPKEALQWIKYLVTTDIQKQSIELSGGNPPVNSEAAADYYSHFDGIDSAVIQQVYEGAIKYGFESYNHLVANYSQINDMFINEMQPIETGHKTVEEVMPTIQKKMTELLARNKK